MKTERIKITKDTKEKLEKLAANENRTLGNYIKRILEVQWERVQAESYLHESQ